MTRGAIDFNAPGGLLRAPQNLPQTCPEGLLGSSTSHKSWMKGAEVVTKRQWVMPESLPALVEEVTVEEPCLV